MKSDLRNLIWPVTTVVCAVIIGAGVYFGLKNNHPPPAPTYGASAAARAAEGTSQASHDQTGIIVYPILT